MRNIGYTIYAEMFFFRMKIWISHEFTRGFQLSYFQTNTYFTYITTMGA